jgi:hypothetical protein
VGREVRSGNGDRNGLRCSGFSEPPGWPSLGHLPEGQTGSSGIFSSHILKSRFPRSSVKRALQLAILSLLVACAWGLPTERPTHISQPSWIFTIGPGTIIAVHAVEVPFVGRYYTVRYRTEKGELIEIRHLRQNPPVLEGMHGLLTYSTSPEMILNFQVVENKTAK